VFQFNDTLLHSILCKNNFTISGTIKSFIIMIFKFFFSRNIDYLTLSTALLFGSKTNQTAAFFSMIVEFLYYFESITPIIIFLPDRVLLE